MTNTIFRKEIEKNKELFDAEIKKFFAEKEKDDSINLRIKKYLKILERFMLNGGKRLRPSVLLNIYKGFGGTKNIIREALSVEFFHNSTLILDDVMDEDELRRGKPTVFKELKDKYFENYIEDRYKGPLFCKDSSRTVVSAAALLANILYTFGSECLNESNHSSEQVKEMLHIYHDSFRVVNEGQMLDIYLEKKDNISEQEYIEMAEKKTAYLLKACGDVGCVLGKASKNQREALNKFAMNITLAFQIHDDLMDINPNSTKGHEIGSDIKQGKATLVFLKALELAEPKDKKILLKVWGKANASSSQIKKVIDIMHRSDAVNYCKNLCEYKVEEGKKWLARIGLKSPQEKFFLGLADFVIKRNN